MDDIPSRTVDFQNTKEAILKEAPSLDGVYLYKSGSDIVYIGKSVNIRARLLSHLEQAAVDPKEAAIEKSATSISCIVTDSEYKALLLESALIKKLKPKYNARWRDDKSYLYVKVTVKDPFPKIYAVRNENDGKSLYFGPFPSMRSIEIILRSIRRIVPYCAQKKIGKHRCFYSRIKLCDPCPSVVAHLSDESQKSDLKKTYRKNIRQIVQILKGNTDAMVKRLERQMKVASKSGDYETALLYRNKIQHFERLLHNRNLLADREFHYNQSEDRMSDLQKLLLPFFPNLPKLHRVECFDVSILSQKEPTASMVVATDGLADKSQYRRFRIKAPEKQHDFAMLKEAVSRRLAHKSWPTPDLIILDGGKPQLSAVLPVLAEHEIPCIGIAKRPDRIIVGIPELPTIKPPLRNLGFSLIRALRDESHRFAKKYHLLLRAKSLGL